MNPKEPPQPPFGQRVWQKIQLSNTIYNKAPSFNDIDIRSEYTGVGYGFMQPWSDVNGKYTLFQISKSYNSMSKLEVVSTLNLYSYGENCYHYNTANSPMKYAIKVYQGQTYTIGYHFDRENLGNGATPTQWPEILEKYNSPNIIQKQNPLII